MTPPRTALLTAALATAALAPAAVAPAALAGAHDAPAVTGAYLYLDRDGTTHRDFVRVVFRTADPLPRRADGAIQAGVSIDGFTHSIGSVRRDSTLYTGAAPVKDHSITSLTGGSAARRGAKVGRSFTVRFFDRDGHRVTRRMTLRAERPGDDTGRPLSGRPAR
jgi:hypothetical protein